MKERFFIVNGSVLPDIFEKVIEVKTLLATRKVKDITEGVKHVGISRSVFYKYKDNVFLLSEMSKGRKATISILLDNKPGILSKILESFAEANADILTINQGIPINEAALVTLTVDISDLMIDIKELVTSLLDREYIFKAEIISIE